MKDCSHNWVRCTSEFQCTLCGAKKAPMKYVLNYGGGVNSSALGNYLQMKGDPLFKELTFIFADTGGEMPATYEYVDLYEKWLKSHGQTLIRVKKDDKTLEQYCLDGHTVPQRMWRWCTDKWKSRPIKEWCDFHVGTPRTHLLAIASDEAHRATHFGNAEVAYVYPLVSAGISRVGCEEIIRHAGLPVPPKSGCFYCPMAPNRAFVDLKKNHPDLFQRVVDMEKKSIAAYANKTEPIYGERPHNWQSPHCEDEDEDCGCPPAPVVGQRVISGGTLKHKPIEDIVGLKDKQQDLFDLFDSGCQSGQCFV